MLGNVAEGVAGTGALIVRYHEVAPKLATAYADDLLDCEEGDDLANGGFPGAEFGHRQVDLDGVVGQESPVRRVN